MATEQLKNHEWEHKEFVFRSVLAFLFVLIAFGGLVWRYTYLQVTEYDRYASQSDRNRVQTQPVVPTRGLIYDRNGTLLADNRSSFTLTIVKEEAGDLEETLASIEALVPLSERDLRLFHRRLKQRRRPHEPVPLRFRLTEDEIALLAVNYYRLPGVQVEADLIRYYPYGAQLVHALGYVGRINDRELAAVDPENYQGTRYIGKLGIEKFYEGELHGKVGIRQVETNARGRVMRVLDQQDPLPGKDLVLSLDLRLQQISEYLLQGRRAAMVAIEPKTGEILSMVSTPGYDPNEFVTGISFKSYAELRDSRDLPLFNRALRGRYPPGSTVKPIIALAAIDSGTVSPDFKVNDPGWYSLSKEGRKYRDWARRGHGVVDLNHAIAQSCDVWFYNVGHKMGIDPMSDYLGRFGFGQITSIDLPDASPAILPSRTWKKRREKLPWYVGDSINLSIGQGYLVATPLQLATATAVIANRGHWVQPHMLLGEKLKPERGAVDAESSEVTDAAVDQMLGSMLEGETFDYKGMALRKLIPEMAPMPPEDVELKNPKYWDLVIQGMVDVMHGRRGTARRVGADAPYRIAGKTGTAQVVGIKQDEEYDADALKERHRDHALFVAFAPVEDPKIAVAVIVENGGGGSTTAAPIARQLMDAWLLGTDPREHGPIELKIDDNAEVE